MGNRLKSHSMILLVAWIQRFKIEHYDVHHRIVEALVNWHIQKSKLIFYLQQWI